jgi:hypothetical protein
MRFQIGAFPILVLCASVLVCGCADDPEAPETLTPPEPGIISAFVVDENLNWPVENVTITVTPGNIVMTTNRDGLAVFEVAPGEYFVDASVCCAGPGGIEYHISVKVSEGETTRVKMEACLVCL